MTSGDFDFFGAPTSPPPGRPSAPGEPPAPTVNQFGMPVAPTVNQFGTPTVGQFGTPAAAAPVRHSAPTPGQMLHRSDNKRQLLLLAGIIAVLVLGTVAFIAAKSQGQKTATSVDHSLDKGLIDAHNAEETADLRNASQLEETYLSDHNTYATTLAELTAAGFVSSPSSRITVVSATGTTFCLRADDPSGRAPAPLFLSSAADVSTTPCT